MVSSCPQLQEWGLEYQAERYVALFLKVFITDSGNTQTVCDLGL